MEDALESLGSRARDFALAALATAYPTEEVAMLFAGLGDAPRVHPGLGPMLRRLDGGVEALQSDYLQRFDSGKGRVALYETEYGRMRGLSKGNDLADIVGFYHAFGFELEEGAEMPDHLAVQMEFYGILLYKSQLLLAAADAEGQEIVLDARRKFLTSHLGSFVAAIANSPQVVEDPVYGPLLSWCAALVAEECRRAEVNPAPLDFFLVDDPDAAPANCGGCVAIPGMDAPGT